MKWAPEPLGLFKANWTSVQTQLTWRQLFLFYTCLHSISHICLKIRVWTTCMYQYHDLSEVHWRLLSLEEVAEYNFLSPHKMLDNLMQTKVNPNKFNQLMASLSMSWNNQWQSQCRCFFKVSGAVTYLVTWLQKTVPFNLQLFLWF